VLVGTGNRDTVFGTLAAACRSHGSEYETNVPVIIRGPDRRLSARSYQRNLDLTAGLIA
jgi:hypothetical protein